MTELALPQDRTGRYAVDVKTFAPLAVVILLVLIMLLVWAEAAHQRAELAADRAQAVRNCHDIIVGLRLFSPDNQGIYPYWIYDEPRKIIRTDDRWGPIYASHEPVTSNDVFRELFKCGACERKDEVIFGCPRSPFHPDGDVGTAPLFKEALKDGENHWAMTGNLTDSSPADFPLIFENPADASATPRWDSDAAGLRKPGRCWADRTVVVGFNDGSVRSMKLEPGTGLRKLEGDAFPVNVDGWGIPPILQVEQ